MILDKKLFIANLNKAFTQNGFGGHLSIDKTEQFFLLTEILLRENEKYNLTAITEPTKIILNHYVDCATPSELIPKGAKIADVGCGAGFPTLPLAILRPDLTIVGIDSTAKRTGYVEMAARELGLTGVSLLTGRAEDFGQDKQYREKFDVVTARAVAPMPILSELCIPLVKVGGQFIAMKGKSAKSELQDARIAIPTLGGKLNITKDVFLRYGDEELSHPLIVIDKVQKTSPTYPRPYAKISKKPL